VSITKDYNIPTDLIYDAETGPLLLIYLRLTAPGKIYVITKIDETSNELNINPPIQLSKKTLFPN
jgi:hypothetical protein